MSDNPHKKVEWETKLRLVSRILSGEKTARVARESNFSRDSLHRWTRELRKVAQGLWEGSKYYRLY